MLLWVRGEFHRNQKFQGNMKNHTKTGGFALRIAWCYLHDLYEFFSGISCLTNKLSNLTIVLLPPNLVPRRYAFTIILLLFADYLVVYCSWQYLFIATHSVRQGHIWLSWQPCVLFISVYWICHMEGWSRLNCRLHALPCQGEISSAIRSIIVLLLVFLLIRIFHFHGQLVAMGHQLMDGN